ncbi:GRAM domain containing 2B L homeolog [Xenopus laevis]|uniref:GRAM domain containing 2B L homeolog n=1 Tax=Xenopus laevis TaxID=8355 RepID=Q5HZR2_XENLA|nr:GRAM domain containing 2B L homeolog [Xenopus laevis]AAH88918.1 LOC496327 protein [Xenopus laevis]
MVVMTEPACESHEPMLLLSSKENKPVRLVSETENGTEERKIGKSPCTTPQIRINDADLLDSKGKLRFSGPGIYESELVLDMKQELKRERKKTNSGQFSKSNAQFHKLFKDIAKEEPLIESFTCALQKDLLYQGKLYISARWVCFHSKVFGKDTKITIPVLTITHFKKTKTALLVPNALVISTITERFIFVSLLSRDTTYKLLKSICGHLELGGSTGNSPNPSPIEQSYRTDRPNSFPLDFNVDFSELDGLMRQRRNDIEDCSSTGSQSAESENSQEFSQSQNVPKSQQVLNQGDVFTVRTQERIDITEHRKGPWRFWACLNIWKMLSMNSLLFIYAIIVCILLFSTLYMHSRIEHLEERLSLTGSTKDSQLNLWSVEKAVEGWPINFNTICGELTDNLEKLDKIQRNLQKLLEDSE